MTCPFLHTPGTLVAFEGGIFLHEHSLFGSLHLLQWHSPGGLSKYGCLSRTIREQTNNHQGAEVGYGVHWWNLRKTPQNKGWCHNFLCDNFNWNTAKSFRTKSPICWGPSFSFTVVLISIGDSGSHRNGRFKLLYSPSRIFRSPHLKYSLLNDFRGK